MSEFKKFADEVNRRYEEIASKGELFTTDVEDIYAEYLKAFPEGSNPIFRERTEHDCNCCKQFITRLGTVVALDPQGNVLTVWDSCYDDLPYPYNVVSLVLARLVADRASNGGITGVFRAKEKQYGTVKTFDTHTLQPWFHFCGRVGQAHFNTSPEAVVGSKAGFAQVLKRGIEELNLSDLDTVLDLIDSNSLYRGAEFRQSVADFRKIKADYEKASNPDTFVWANLDSPASRFRNTSIGTLLVDLAKGVELDKAVKSFESKVAPQNYKRPSPVITSRMVEDAMSKVKMLGLESSLKRRFARMEDISVNDVLYVDRNVQNLMKDSITSLLMEQVKPKTPKNAGNMAMRDISGEEFFNEVVPKSTSIEVLVENKHLGNFVSLTAPEENDNSGNLFKWNNDVAWTYDGEVTDALKQRVKEAGGKVDAIFRVSLGWFNFDDLDIHMVLPSGSIIYFNHKYDSRTRGQLDVDMNASYGNSRAAVENIFFNDRSYIADGRYSVSINNYCKRESIDYGFEVEVEFDGAVHNFTFDKPIGDKKSVYTVDIIVKNGKLVSVETVDPGVKKASRQVEKWGVTTGQMVPVETIMLSPNYWNGQKVGNKHHFFILKNAKNPDAARGIYNEFLRNDLEEHRKVFEILGAKTKAEPSDQQLSGLGFSSTRKDEVVAIADGRPYNVKF